MEALDALLQATDLAADMTKIFAIATFLYLLIAEVIKNLDLNEESASQASFGLYFAFLFSIY